MTNSSLDFKRLKKHEELLCENVIEVFNGTSNREDNKIKLEFMVMLLFMPPQISYMECCYEKQLIFLPLLACGCFVHWLQAISLNVNISANRIRNQLSFLLLNDSDGILRATLLDDSGCLYVVKDIPSSKVELRKELIQHLWRNKETQLLWYLAVWYLRYNFQILTEPQPSDEQINILMILAVRFLQNEQAALIQHLLTSEDLHLVQEKAIRTLQYLLVDDRQPATLQADVSTISPEENERRTKEAMDDLFEKHLDKLHLYGESYVDLLKPLIHGHTFVDSGAQRISEAKAELLQFCFVDQFNVARCLLRQILTRNLIVEMPSCMYNDDSKQLEWTFIKYGDNIDWLERCISSVGWNQWMLCAAANQNVTQVCWPGDKKPIIEPHPCFSKIFNDRVTVGKSNTKPYHVSLKQTNCDGVSLDVHHVISRRLLRKMYELFHKMQEKEEPCNQACPQSDHRFINLINYNQLKYEIPNQGCPQINHRLDNLINYNQWKLNSIFLSNSFAQRNCKNMVIPEFVQFGVGNNLKVCSSETYKWHMSSSGNLFAGPIAELRGPFHPSKQKSDPDFETEAEPILGAQRYAEFHELYIEIQDLVYSRKKKNKKRGLAEVEKIMCKCENLFEKYDAIPYDKTQWKKRPPTDDELNNLGREAKKTYTNKKEEYWAIRSKSDAISRPPTGLSGT